MADAVATPTVTPTAPPSLRSSRVGDINLYATLQQAKGSLGIRDTVHDDAIYNAIAIASREIEDFCGRWFYTWNETRYFDVQPHKPRSPKWFALNDYGGICEVDDFVTLDSVYIDWLLNDTFNQEMTYMTDFIAYPKNKFPKMTLVIPINRPPTASVYRFPIGRRTVKMQATWGYGNETSNPWRLLPVTLTVADGTTTTVVASDLGIEDGMTLLCENEQLFVQRVASDGVTLTCVRGVNNRADGGDADYGEATGHTAKACSVALYPGPIVYQCIYIASMNFGEPKTAGLDAETIGTYSWRKTGADNRQRQWERAIGAYRRWTDDP